MTTDLILVGGGLANTLIALRLAERQPHLKVILLEQSAAIGGNHTWSFHGSDLPAESRTWLTGMACYHWPHTEVRFPNQQRTLAGTYHSLTSERLAAIAQDKLAHIQTGAQVTDIQPSAVTLADGAILEAHAIIDGRGPAPDPNLDVRFQKFVGQVVELKQPHYLTGPIIMDATIEQQDGYRFLYTLPLTATSLLIEDTRYSDGPDISEAEYAGEIESYAHAQGWHISELLRTESGILPITLGGDIEAFWDTGPQDVARSGLRAALFHPVTGYSLPQAVRLAETISKLDDFSARSIYDCTRQQSRTLWEQTGFYRALNRMLFLAADPEQRWQILERFYGLNEPLITRFFAGHNTLLDKARILIGKPPVGLSKAYDSVFRYSR